MIRILKYFKEEYEHFVAQIMSFKSCQHQLNCIFSIMEMDGLNNLLGLLEALE